jgi:hypothetical protein
MMIGDHVRKWLFMRDHRWTQDHLSSYIDRELGSRERERVDRHTDLCPECHRALATLRRTVQALRRLGIDDGEFGRPEGGSSQNTPGPVAEGVIGYLRRSG